MKTCDANSQEECLNGAPAESENVTPPLLGLNIIPAAWAINSTLDDTSGLALAFASIGFASKSLAILADGTLVGFQYDSACNLSASTILEYDQKTPIEVKKACIAVTVDTNGPKKPNKVSRDRYQFAIGKLGVVTKDDKTKDDKI